MFKEYEPHDYNEQSAAEISLNYRVFNCGGSFLAIPWHMELLNQGLNPSRSCNLHHHSCGNAGFFLNSSSGFSLQL